ncbi:MAG: glycosyltransferase family 2 protein [Elusimicrobia bacterium]|nr:glycosyltransferase family 2 protein [Elusimicrobiota bacterium]
MKPRVAVIVLNYNGAKDTIECLNSLIKVNYPNFEIIVVDNKSTDDSWAQIQGWITPHPSPLTPHPFSLIQSGSNRGYAAGNNAGIRQALDNGADYVWILNNDTIVDSNCLKFLIETAESDPKTGMVGATTYYYDQPDKIQCLAGGYINRWLGTSRFALPPKKSSAPDNLLSTIYYLLSPLDYINGACILAKTAMIRDIGLLDERFFLYWEDTDWSFRARGAGWRLAWSPKAVIRHKEGGLAKTTATFMDYHHAKSALVFFSKYPQASRFSNPAILITTKLLSRLLRGQYKKLRAVSQAAADRVNS